MKLEEITKNETLVVECDNQVKKSEVVSILLTNGILNEGGSWFGNSNGCIIITTHGGFYIEHYMSRMFDRIKADEFIKKLTS